MKERRLPLGVDIGASRVRVIALSRRNDGFLRLLGAGAADVVDHPANALQSALEQASTPERRCVAMIRSCDAGLRNVVLPPMSRRDANRAARFEALAASDAGAQTLTVRSTMLECNSRGERRMLVAATPSRIVRETISVLAAAGLRPVCIDHEACAFSRACNSPVLDVALERSSLVACAQGSPVIRTIGLGGNHFTKAVARDYGIAEDAAEARKRTIGLTGAAKDVLSGFVRALDAELRILRDGDGFDVTSMRLCGNGARLPELREEIEQQLQLRVETVQLGGELVTELPEEVQRTAAMDWFAAFAAARPACA